MARSNKRTHVCSRANHPLNQEFQIELRIVCRNEGCLNMILNPYSLSNHPNWKSNGHDQIIMSSRVELLGKRERERGGGCVWTCPVSGPQKCDPPTSSRGEYLSMTCTLK
jgi:hypothetical protein